VLLKAIYNVKPAVISQSEWERRIIENDRLKHNLRMNKQAGQGVDFLRKLKNEVQQLESYRRRRNQTAELPLQLPSKDNQVQKQTQNQAVGLILRAADEQAILPERKRADQFM